ncbi:hypothetical protein Y032_0094g2734 [Ancylostoma ceylanicum]|uniref:Uncharacterized protein n=1 Tax=Ancylostoma ceylanicum TaxID=53326 RepID=A0A016TL21_9BILA|nr:hypothetical protein Y032_0094g2734 [Ancylostoma ceylanicum]
MFVDHTYTLADDVLLPTAVTLNTSKLYNATNFMLDAVSVKLLKVKQCYRQFGTLHVAPSATSLSSKE